MSEKPASLDRQLVLALQRHRVDRVLDVGANAGQYAMRLRRSGWCGRILSFEPLADLHAELVRAASADCRWEVAPRMALGARAERAVLQRSAESDMSSLAAQTPLLERLSPSSAVVAEEVVDVRPLADVVVVAPAERLFLKLDVQGTEMAVLDGLGGLWAHLVGLQLELALTLLYAGETRYLDVCRRLESLGFALALVVPGYFDGKLARQLQFDGVFLREDG